MNQNQLARLVTLLEGKKISLSIAQVKEVMHCENIIIRPLPWREKISMLRKRFFTKG